MTPLHDVEPRRAHVNAWLAYVGAPLTLTGVQMIAPSLPAMRDALGLGDAELALVTSVYLLPAALAAIPAGLLADRIGRRRVFGWAMVLFGVLGAILPLVSGSFGTFVVVRFLQGVAFAGLLPLTMTILGDAYSGARLVGAQGRRSVAMSIGDGVLPVVGGFLAAFGWFVPWLGQTLAVPFGVIVLMKLTDVDRDSVDSGRTVPRPGAFLTMFGRRSVIALQYAGFLRMFLKFALLTYLPVFLVDVRNVSTGIAGLVIGVAALSGTLIALFAGRLAVLGSSVVWILAGVLVMGVMMIAEVTVPWVAGIFAASVLYGAADGLMGVFTNALVTAAPDADQRASFVAATGAIRNFAKFMAPATVGALAILAPLSTVFVGFGGLTIVSAATTRALGPLERRLRAGAP